MLVVSLFSWWYGAGWRDQLDLLFLRLSRVSDHFSIALLLRSLFAPFRQISAGSVRGGFDVQLRAWLDRLVSRCIGAMIRTALIITGALLLFVELLLGGLRMIIWPLVPLLPVVGLIIAIVGWIPWQR